MPVIVNELEVVVESQGEPAPEGPSPAAAAPQPVLTPLELQEVLDRRARLARRTFAH